jgi:hypothetical protein
MDQMVLKFLNSQSIAPEYPGTILDTITNPAAPEHAAHIIRTADGRYRLDVLQISGLDTSTVTVRRPTLNPGENWVGTIHDHPQLPTEELVQSNGMDLPTARRFNRIAPTFGASYVVGPSGVGPYVGVVVFEPQPGPGSLVTLGVGP